MASHQFCLGNTGKVYLVRVFGAVWAGVLTGSAGADLIFDGRGPLGNLGGWHEPRASIVREVQPVEWAAAKAACGGSLAHLTPAELAVAIEQSK